MSKLFTGFLLAFFVLSSVSAQELSGISIDPQEITIGKPVQITIDIKSQSNLACGVYIAYGDGSSERIRVAADNLPLVVTHTYDRAGNFAISVEGKLQLRGLSSVLPCFGATLTAALNVKAEDFAEKEAAEKAAQEAALQKAAAERRAAERAAQRATADRVAAEKAAQRAAVERAAAEKTEGVSARAAATKKSQTDQSAAEAASSAQSRSRAPASEATPKAAPVKARSAMDL